jgi:hypothetical protein
MAEPLVTYLDSVLAMPIDASNMFVYASKLRLVMAYTMSSDNVPHARIADTVKYLKSNRTNVQGARADGS